MMRRLLSLVTVVLVMAAVMVVVAMPAFGQPGGARIAAARPANCAQARRRRSWTVGSRTIPTIRRISFHQVEV
jgi:hypothetical protein